MKPHSHLFWVTSSIALCCSAIPDLTQAQIVPSGATRRVQGPCSPTCRITIEGGTRAKSNLFHSFSKFNVGIKQEVLFSDPGVKNILSRVTGDDPSRIFGKLGVVGDANLFLMNPKGVIFGPNASLDLRGSFVVTTANAIQFGNKGFFSASASNDSRSLTIDPSAFLFNQIAAQSIKNQSNKSFEGLKVQDGRSLLLVGGDVKLDRGILTAPGGHVELGGVAKSGTVGLNIDGSRLSLSFPQGVARANVSLTNSAQTNVVANEGGGSIAINTQNLKLLNGGKLLAGIENFSGAPNSQEGDIVLDIIGAATVEGYFSRIENASGFRARGNAGDIEIRAGSFSLADGATIKTTSLGLVDNKAGSISITADNFISIKNKSFVLSENYGLWGNGGNINIKAGSFSLIDESQLSTTSFGGGRAGNVTIKAGLVTIQDEAEVAVGIEGNGERAGNLRVEAPLIFLDNKGKLTAINASGIGGNIALEKLNLLLLNNESKISASAGQSGKGGNITVNTDLLVGRQDSDIMANAENNEAGRIDITTTQGIVGLEVRNKLTKNSDITAFSENNPSLNRRIYINTPDVDPDEAVVNLPEEVDVGGLVAQSCRAGGGAIARRSSEFVVTGRGGLPPTPGEALKSDTVLVDLGTSVSAQELSLGSGKLAPVASGQATSEKLLHQAPGRTVNHSSPSSTNLTHPASDPIVEAQGWMTGPKGEVVLTTQAPTATPNGSGLASAVCHGS